MTNLYPWLAPTWQQLIGYKKQHIIPTGIMLSGPEGVGKYVLANAYAKSLFCREAESACHQCRSCTLFQVGNHPDFFLIQTEEKAANIKIDQIRHLTECLSQTSVLGGFQIALISLAEEMTKASCNALLKTLEEPPGNVVIILVSHQPSSVIATVISRCQHIRIPIPKKQHALPWLESELQEDALAVVSLSMADGLPLKALNYAKANQQAIRDKLLNSLLDLKKEGVSPIQVAADCIDDPLGRLQFLLTITLDMLRMKVDPSLSWEDDLKSGSSQVISIKEFLNHRDKIVSIYALSQLVSQESLFAFLDKIIEAVSLLKNRSNVNLQLLMENIFITWRYNNEIS